MTHNLNPNSPDQFGALAAVQAEYNVAMAGQCVIRCHCGRIMEPVGRGKYPYPCIAQDKHPTAMVYECNHGTAGGPTGWTTDVRRANA